MDPDNPLFPFYAQGFRCAHIDGRRRCGVYVFGEEHIDSLDAALLNTDGCKADETSAWQMGWIDGYRCGACGDDVPSHVKHARLPQ